VKQCSCGALGNRSKVTDMRDIGIHVCSRWLFNCYVVVDGGSGRPFVVDPGLPITARDAAGLMARLQLPRPALLTAPHGHSDHVGGMPWLHRRCRAPIHLTAKVRDFLAGERARAPGLRAFSRLHPMLGEQPFSCLVLFQWLATSRREGFGVTDRFRFSAPVEGFLEDGDRLPGAPHWEVILTPGHSACSACFWNCETRTLISGDVVLTLRGRAWFNPSLVDEAAMDRTEDRVRGLHVKHLLPGHGRPIHGDDLMSTAWSWREQPVRSGGRNGPNDSQSVGAAFSALGPRAA
jgi:glyoxylase-like metal-dependent hydrolase (beta-lactamase superfamily II)